MKRVISMLLTLVIIMCSVVTFSVTASAEAAEEVKVGYAREIISPSDIPCGMDGDYEAQSVNDDLFATAVAISDGETTVLLITLDVIYISKTMHSEMISSITEGTSIPAANIYIHATHNHSSPNYVLAEQAYQAPVQAWITKTISNTLLAAKNAIADLAVSEIYTGKSETENLNCVRKPQYDQEVDEEIQAIRFVRDGKKDVVLANWQAHPASSVTAKVITADYIGEFRRLVEETNNVYFAYFNGANGNLNVKLSGAGDKLTAVNAIGVALANKLNAMLADENLMKKSRIGKIRTAASDYNAEIAPVDEETKAKVLKLYAEGKTSREDAQSIGLESEYVLRALKKRIDLTADGSTTTPIHLAAMSFGDVGFVFAPYEMFDDNGVEIKEASPFETTFVCTLIGGHNYEYIHSDSEYGKGVYEVWVCIFTRGIGERLAQSFVSLLNDTASYSYIETMPEGSIRMVADGSGLRFRTVISKEYIEELVYAYGEENVSVGTIIAPFDTVSGLQSFTKEALDAAEILYVDVKASLRNPYASDENTNTYAGSLINIKHGNTKRDFVAVGYIAVTDSEGNTTYYYSSSVAKRNVRTIAVAALNDLKESEQDNYTHKVEICGKIYYSKYSSDQRDIITKIIENPKDPYDKDIFDTLT